MKLGRLLLRLAIGVLFVGHGTQKLFGWFGGHGLEGTSGFFEQLGLRPGRRNAIAAGASEAGGGAALALGLGTPFAASALIGTMLTAVHRVHFKNGPWITNGGYEYNLVLVLALLALVEVGPGPLSLDAALDQEHTGVGWSLAALALAAGGAVGVHQLSQSAAPVPAEPQQAFAPATAQEPAEARPQDPQPAA